MKNWKAVEVCLFILTLTIPLCLIGMLVVRLITRQPIPPESATVVMDMLKIIGGGVLGIIGTLYSQTKKEE